MSIEHKKQMRVESDKKNRDNMFLNRGAISVLDEVFECSSMDIQILLIDGEFKPRNINLDKEWTGMTLSEKKENVITLISKLYKNDK